MGLSKKDIAYDYLRKEIVFCRLNPGDILDEKQIADDLGVSRTPVREALNELSKEKLVTILPRKGIFVSQISLKDLQDMIECRELIEPYLIQRCCSGVDTASLQAFRARIEDKGTDSGDMTDCIEDDFDYSFHMFFATQAGNVHLEQLMSTLLALSQRTRVFLPFSPERVAASSEEHLAIIDCVLNGDVEGVNKVIREHLEHTRDGYMQVFGVHNDFFRA